MGCQLSCAVRGQMLQAVVSGKCPDQGVGWIAHAIVEQAVGQAVDRILIDVRRLADRLGSLGTLALTAGDACGVRGYRSAVLDVKEHDRYYALHEVTARKRGFALRSFSDALDATRWLALRDD